MKRGKINDGRSQRAESSESYGFDFDVFLSFRGCDTRSGFTGHLYQALRHKGVSAFLDEEYLSGSSVVNSLLRAIEASNIFVVILSEGYADSRWCLFELTKIVESNRLILPVFFHVHPSDVRHQSGPFEEAFRRHQENNKVDAGEVNKWRYALRTVAEISGYDLDTGGHESELIVRIVQRILGYIGGAYLHVAKYPVGVPSRVEDMMELLDIEAYDVRMVGICGIGGAGKTTLAKAVYNQCLSQFRASSFIANIKDVWKKFNGLIGLQKQLIADLLKDKKPSIDSIDQGIDLIKRKIGRKRVFVVLDDVDDKRQLEALAGSLDWFCVGSRVIITTRNKDVFNVKSVKEGAIYLSGELNDDESLQLFSNHAFGVEKPIRGFIKLSKEAVEISGRLPLTLEVLGSSFSGITDPTDWRLKLDKLKEIKVRDVQQYLRISYDELDKNEKQILLDIACLFIGKDKDNAIYMWKDCGLSPNIALKNLIDKSLVKLNNNKKFDMHNEIRDMGRDIVEVERRQPFASRMLVDDDDGVSELLGNPKDNSEAEDMPMPSWESRIVEGIVFHVNAGEEKLRTEMFAIMPNLRLLHVNYANMHGEFRYLPRNLKWLEWKGCPLESLPCDFNLEKIVVLDLSDSKISCMLQSSNKIYCHLKVLDLSGCNNLVRTPDFSNFPCLEKLGFDGCHELCEVHESIGFLRNLVFLNMRGCYKLQKLPDKICWLGSLKIVDFSLCLKLSTVPDWLGDLESLTKLLLCRTAIQKIPDSIKQLKCLQFLSLEECESLKALPDSIGGLDSLEELILDRTAIKGIPKSVASLKKLKTLSVRGCKSFAALPPLIGEATNLVKIFLDGTLIEELPDSVGDLENLMELSVCQCSKLRILPEPIGKLKSLQSLDVNGTGITKLPENFGNLSSLSMLKMASCKSFTKLPEKFGDLKFLRFLNLRHNSQLTMLPDSFFKLTALETLRMDYSNLCILQSSLSSLSKLTELSLFCCLRLNCLPQLPRSLVKLHAYCCTDLKSIADLSNLENLQELHVTNCENLSEVQGLDRLKSLRSLHMCGCNNLSKATRSRFVKEMFGHLEIFSISGSTIPCWFTHQSKEQSVTLNSTFEGLLLCLVFGIDGEVSSKEVWYWEPAIEIEETVEGQSCITTLAVPGIPVSSCNDNICFWYVNYLDVDESEIRVTVEHRDWIKGLRLKKFGIHLLDGPLDEARLSRDIQAESLCENLAKLCKEYEAGAGTHFGS